MTDLVERLNDLRLKAFHNATDKNIYFGSLSRAFQNGDLVAATALEAKDKELAALREQLAKSEGERDHYLSSWKEARAYWNIETTHAELAEARAETTERERDHFKSKAHEYFGMYDEALRGRDEAIEALKPFSTLARWLPTKTPDDEVVYRASTIVITAGDLRRAARAITGGKL